MPEQERTYRIGERRRYRNGNVGEWDGVGFRLLPADQVPQPISDREPGTWAGGVFKGFMEGSGKQLGTAAGVGAATALTGGLGFFPALAALTGGGVLGRLAGRKVTQAAGGKTEGTALDDAIAGGLEGAAGATAGPAVKLIGRAIPPVVRASSLTPSWLFPPRAAKAVDKLGTWVGRKTQDLGEAMSPSSVKRAFGNVPDIFESTSDDLAEQAARAAAGRGARMRSAAGMGGQSRPIPVSQAEHQAMQTLSRPSPVARQAVPGESFTSRSIQALDNDLVPPPPSGTAGPPISPSGSFARMMQGHGARMSDDTIAEEVSEALMSRFGYSAQNARNMAQRMSIGATSTEEALERALKEFGRR